MSWFKSKQVELAENLYDEQVYAKVAEEIASKNMWPGLWAKAFAQADGNEQQAKAIYIKLRASQIKLGVDAEREIVTNAERELSADMPAKQPDPNIEDEAIHPKCGGHIAREEIGAVVRWRCRRCGQTGKFSRGTDYSPTDELARHGKVNWFTKK